MKSEEIFDEHTLNQYSEDTKRLEKKIICNNCSIKKKSNGICPEEIELACDYS